MPRRLATASLFAACWGAALAAPAVPSPGSGIDWPAFLGRHDLIWADVPATWGNCAFIGNGNVGATIHKIGPRALGWEINQTELTEAGSRYPMGHLSLQAGGEIDGGQARLNLWNAEATGTLRTAKGDVTWRSFACANPPVIVVEYDGRRGDNQMDLLWMPALARPSGPPREHGDDMNPPPRLMTGAGLVTSTQRLVGSRASAVVLRRIFSAHGRRSYVLAVGRGPTEDAARVAAEAADDQAASMGMEALTAAHRRWWHAYYSQSFLSVPDSRLEAFYWIQIYKLGSAMRAGGPILDLMGPWYRTTPWPALWWDLHTERAYSPVFTANRLGLAESLFGTIDRFRQALVDNAPAARRGEAAVIGRTSGQRLIAPVNLATAQSDTQREVGDLTLVMQLYWEFYRYQMNDSILRDRVVPLLGQAVGTYLALVEKSDDGRYHLPRTFSPELTSVRDANFDLALLRWGLRTLISSCELLRIDDPRLTKWRDVLAHLTNFPAGPSGLLIGRDRPLTASNRYYSHLLAIYPLHLFNPDVPEDRALIQNSVRNWTSRPQEFKAFSHTGAASLEAMLGEGDKALGHLHALLDKFVQPNTFYMDVGPMMDGPLSGATSLQEMLLQSWGEKIRIFPAVPAAWQSAAFATLRTEGAFLISARRDGGRTRWVRVQSLAGSPCRLQIKDWKEAAVRSASTGADVSVTGAAGEFSLAIPKQAWAVLGPKGVPADAPRLMPIEELPGERNPYPQHYR